MTKVDPLLHFALLVWLFEFIAFIKYVNLVGYYRLHPCDLVLPPISVLRLLSWFDQDVLCIHSRQVKYNNVILLDIAIQRYPSTIMTETMSRMLGQDINLKTDRHNLSDREITPPALAPYLNSVDYSNISGSITVYADSHSHLQKIKSGEKMEAGITTSTRYGYRMFPDWQTSYLWYDPLWPQNPSDESHVDEKTIKDRYPILAPFYLAWRDVYEKSFEQQGCDMGSGLEPFPDTADRVAWEVEGFLIACWLGLQDDTEQVLYTLPTGTYQIDKKSKDSVLRQFLIDEDNLLRRDDR
ncbi:predicted protein [Histoplasma mississippiense (nom. inval.)]|uniref:predicted protein n=1 Tax=Ajellomyces capsulatus (strain NAm1 / WU24) TaxID=2059318 RepID=UPI000157C6E6|nr:predicted protein [Histoplasma mississippiense (nom. inval.)]EDN08141.1 predicted protein [Histoplasma mississippiense (nom. inval.)]